GESAQGGLGIEGQRLQRGVEPELVGGGKGPGRGVRVAAEDDAGEVVAMDGGADGVAEDGGSDPLFAEVRDGGGGHLVEPEEFGIEGGTKVAGGGGHFFGDAVETFWLHFADELRFAAQKAGDFDFAVGLDVDADGTEVRLAAFPKIRIASEADEFARFVFGDEEGSGGGGKFGGAGRNDGESVEEA